MVSFGGRFTDADFKKQVETINKKTAETVNEEELLEKIAKIAASGDPDMVKSLSAEEIGHMASDLLEFSHEELAILGSSCKFCALHWNQLTAGEPFKFLHENGIEAVHLDALAQKIAVAGIAKVVMQMKKDEE